ncbi:MAG: hypothetical protein P4N59_03375 [Negativicutes bacterium]|nr:hypothetical protein [Negativicutes bacterium]
MKTVVIGNKYGQLGNRLFSFANFIGNAIEDNYRVINPFFYEYAPYFENCRNRLIVEFPHKSPLSRLLFLKPLIKKAAMLLSILTNLIGDFSVRKRMVINAWTQDDRNRIKHADKIRSFFRVTQTHAKQISEFIRQSRNEYDILVGIHMRLGDYKTFSGGKFFYTSSQYTTVMKQMLRLFPDKKIGFIICSNETIDVSEFSGFPVIRGTNHIVEDMYCLAECDYITGPPSTYTMWASFYGKVPLHMLIDIEREITKDCFSVYL